MESQFVYCPLCSTPLKKITSKFEHVERTGCPKCGFIDYNNSRPTVSALILNDKKEVLLVRRSWHPYKGFLDIPGGFLEGGEHPCEGLRREMREELNVEIEFSEIPFTMEVDVYDDFVTNTPFSGKGAPILNIFFEARLCGEVKINDEELAGITWMKLTEALSRLDEVGFTSNRNALIKLGQTIESK